MGIPTCNKLRFAAIARVLKPANPSLKAKLASKLKAAQLAAEIAEMKRKITVQELRQAGQPVPPV